MFLLNVGPFWSKQNQKTFGFGRILVQNSVGRTLFDKYITIFACFMLVFQPCCALKFDKNTQNKVLQNANFAVFKNPKNKNIKTNLP